MSLSNEYVIIDAIKSVDDVTVYRADHPIHGTVNVYLADEALPAEIAVGVKRRLYKSGRQLRNISLLNIPFVTKVLDISQNPNDPYVVVKYTRHDLDELISNGVTLNPKRVFTILSQVLRGIINLADNDWAFDQMYLRQIKLTELNSGDISLTLIEGVEQQLSVTKTAATEKDDKPGDAAIAKEDAEDKDAEGEALKGTAATSTVSQGLEHTVTFKEDGSANRFLARQKNIGLLANAAYQLLFGRKYLSRSKGSAADIKTLSGRWARILEKTFSRDANRRYNTYEKMLHDIKRALSRNKRWAVASIPFWLILLIAGSYMGYQRYHQHKIMTSPAGQAIESFLNVVNKADDKFPELETPRSPDPAPDDKAILKPFDKIETISEDEDISEE